MSPGQIKTRFRLLFTDDRSGDHSESEVGGGSEGERWSAANPGATMNSSAPLPVSQDLQASTVDALRRHYGAPVMEQSLRIIADAKRAIEIARDQEYQPPTIFEKMLVEPPSVHQTRLIANYMSSLDTRAVVLHRKRFFDDQYEKLIIMAVQLKYFQKDQQQDSFARDVDGFDVILQEPETGQEALYFTAFQGFLTPDEFAHELEQGSFRSKTDLKRLAR